jgi:hypothetical protein
MFDTQAGHLQSLAAAIAALSHAAQSGNEAVGDKCLAAIKQAKAAVALLVAE